MALMGKLVKLLAKRKAKEIEHILQNQVSLTEKKIMEIVAKHEHTKFGKDHGYEHIKSPEDFAKAVPLRDFYGYRPYLQLVYDNPTVPIITADPTIWYVTSSGSTGKPKFLPINKAGLKDYTAGSMLYLMAYVGAHPDNAKLFDGTMVTFAAPANLGEINGVPRGYMTGISRELVANAITRRRMKPGVEVFNLMDIEEKMCAYAKYCIEDTNIAGFGGITTLTISFMRRMQNEYGPWLLDEYKGTKHEARIRECMDDEGRLDLAQLWPKARWIGATGIDSGPYMGWLKKTLPDAWVWEAYSGSEALYGGRLLPYPGKELQLFSHLNYFEFIPENQVEKKEPEAVPLSDVKKNSRYELVITNLFGWARYRVGDMVTIVNTDPISVAHIGRKGKIVNLSGEKLADAHVTKAIAEASRITGAEVVDYTVIGQHDSESAQPYYTIMAMTRSQVDPIDFVNAFEEAVMRKNNEFKIVRKMGALGATRYIAMKKSHFEGIIEQTHIQAKSVPLSSDKKLLEEYV